MNARIVAAILRKDVLSLLPLVAMTALLFLGDALLTRLEILAIWTAYGPAVLLVALLVIVMTVLQLDSPASMSDDWLCRPLRVRELLAAKFALIVATTYLPRAVGVFVADLSLGYPVREALQDALLLPDKFFPFIVLIFLFAAIVTRTFVQGFSILFVIFICVFAIPTPFVRPPGPLTPGIRDDLWYSGMAWLSTTPAWVACLLMLVAGFWLVYRRRLGQARFLLAATVGVTVLLLVTPMAWLPWETTFALQKSLGARERTESATGASTGPDLSRISLRNTQVCFPAVRRDALGDPGFDTARRKAGLQWWDEEVLQGADPESVAFLTHIEPWGLPLDWRVKLNYVQAEYSGAGKRFSLRPAHYLTDENGHRVISHAWMLPAPALEQLPGSRSRLQLTYSLTLLRPREHALRVDGKRHALPGLGSCSARRHEGARLIAVDCFSTPAYPAQITAELPDIPATRAHGPVNFSPGWVQWPFSSRVKLSIPSPRLSLHDHITVTAWQVAAYIDESLSLPGILGADPTTCPLPGDAAATFQNARWSDSAPHEAHTIAVDAGVQLEVLDFGGNGPAVVLLPGLGATAHSFDELAPQLATAHRVIAITRRGTGNSSRPDFGFDTPRLAQDVLAVIEQMELQRPLLVGHSIAGEELTWLGAHHGERFMGLVYLDAAFDRAGQRSDPRNRRWRELHHRLPPEPPFPPTAFLNYAATIRLLEQRGHQRLPEGELIAFLNANQPFLAGTPNIDARAQQAMLAAVRSPDYARVKIPALAIYAFPDSNEALPPWYDARDPQLLATVREIRSLSETIKRENLERFRREVPKGEVLELLDANHYLTLSNPREVLAAITGFSARVRLRGPAEGAQPLPPR
jgi:non-heme chloroperoxidase